MLHGPDLRRAYLDLRNGSFLFAFVTIFLSAVAEAGTLSVALTCHGDSPCRVEGAALLRSVADSSVVRQLNVDDFNRLLINESPGSEWDLSLDARGFWALPRRVVVPAEEGERQETLQVWPTGRIAARVKTPASAPAATTELRAVVASPPDRRVKAEIPHGTYFACTNGAAGNWICDVPATPLDISLNAPGFAPHYAWGIRAPPAGTVDLGTIVLKKGASIVAWLDDATLTNMTGPVSASLRYHTAGDSNANAERLAKPLAETTFTPKGMVQFAPLAAGRYILEAKADGYAPARLTVDVVEGRESILRHPIELSPAVHARLRLEPAVDGTGSPWNVDIARRVPTGAGWERAANGPASAGGVFEARDQSEGPVKVVVRDSTRNVLASRELLFTRDAAEHLIRLDLVTISGKVTIGDERLPRASLLFGGSGGAEKVKAAADDEGSFSVSLPRRGKWVVEVDAPEAEVAAVTEILLAEDSDTADIELPATEISGWVVGPGGERVAAADVEMLLARGMRRRVTDSSGNFRFRGVRSGLARIQAVDPRTHAYSKVAEVAVPEEGVTSKIALAIESFRQVKGIVRSEGSPLVGARVHGYAFIGGAAQQEQATTDIHGAFAFDAPESAPQMILVVGAPGRPLHAFNAAVPQDSVILELPPRGGTVALLWPGDANPVRVLFNEILLPMSDLLDWARAHGEFSKGGAVQVPNVAAGKYQFCNKERCVDGVLPVGGRLELDLRPSPGTS